MSIPSSDRAIALSLSTGAKAETPAPTSRLEEEVIELFDELRDSLFRYVLSFSLSAHDGEDIVQEVFLSLFRHLQLGRCKRNLRGWVFRVAHNLALKRRYANEKERGPQADAAGAGRQLDQSPSAEEQLVFQESQAHLLAVFRALPEADQRCLRLRAEGLRYREIAEVLGVSLGAVSLYLTRSLARLERARKR